MIDIDVEKILPHRDRLKLIDEILEAGDGNAVTAAVVSDKWPLFRDNAVNSLILIELIAQTSGIAVGYKKLMETGKGVYGWIVGVKQVDFSVEKIPLGARLINKVASDRDHGNYIVFSGSVELNREIICRMEIQIFSPE